MAVLSTVTHARGDAPHNQTVADLKVPGGLTQSPEVLACASQQKGSSPVGQIWSVLHETGGSLKRP